MNERTIVKSVAALLATVVVVTVGGTDALFVAVSILFFAICIAYAEWCQRL